MVTGRHERRGRHEVCGASLGPVFWGYICDRIAGHGGGHWAESLKVDAPRGPITYLEILCTACGRPWGGAHAESCPLWSAWTTEDDRGRRIRGLLP